MGVAGAQRERHRVKVKNSGGRRGPLRDAARAFGIHRQKTVGTAIVHRARHAEWTNRPVTTEDRLPIPRRPAPLRRARQIAGGADPGPRGGRQQRQYRIEGERIGDGERDHPAADQAIHGASVGLQVCCVHRR